MIRLDRLPAPQRAMWESDLPGLPPHFVLYGGTAIALHLGHRESVDFDFFSSDRLTVRRSAGRARCSRPRARCRKSPIR